MYGLNTFAQYNVSDSQIIMFRPHYSSKNSSTVVFRLVTDIFRVLHMPLWITVASFQSFVFGYGEDCGFDCCGILLDGTRL